MGLTRFPNGVRSFDATLGKAISSPPLSGTSGTGAADWAHPGTVVYETQFDTRYINVGTLASPYWQPLGFDQYGILGIQTDFRSGLGKAVADTATTATIADGTGVRVHGQGIAETDAGLTVAFAEGGGVASLIATNEDAHVAALSHGDTTPQFQPDTHGPLYIEADLSISAALTNKMAFVGFVGTIADALDPPVTGATTVLTLVQDDLAGLFYSAGLTDGDRWFAPHNKSNEAATIATTATGVDTGVDVAAAGTYQRVRVEISQSGVMTCFINQVQVSRIAASLDVDEEVSPVCLVGSLTTATATMLLRRFAAWGHRA